MSEAELRWLAEVAQHMTSIAELGCWKGRSTYALAAACKGTVYAVDHWRGSEDELTSTHQEATQRDIITDFRANTRGLKNVRMIVADVDEAATFVPTVDMVFLDAGHSEAATTRTINAWSARDPKLMVGHDYNWPSVAAAVNNYCIANKRNLYLGPGSLWFLPRWDVVFSQAGIFARDKRDWR